jgi:MFS family permease
MNSLQRWFMWIISVFFVVFQLFTQLSSGIMLCSLMQEYDSSPFFIALLSCSFYLIYIAMQIPAGMIVDRWGPRVIMTSGASVCAIGCLLFSHSHTLSNALLARILIGAGASCAFICMVNIAFLLFPKKQLSLMVGLAESAMMLGTWFSEMMLANFLKTYNWRIAMTVCSYIALSISLASWLFVRTKIKKKYSHNLLSWTELRWLFSQALLWKNGIYIGLVFSCVTVFASFWSIPFISKVQGIDTLGASLECGFIFVGLAISSLCIGVILRNQMTMRRTYFYSAMLAFILMLKLVYFTPSSMTLGSVLFFSLGVCCSITVINYAIANAFVPTKMAATSIGFTNAIALIIIPILHLAIGGMYSAMTFANSSSHTSYTTALSLMPLALFIAAVISLCMSELRATPTMVSQ